jgi:HPt (histidine-containing phosphotransfer) domain-containing protein
MEPVEQNPLQQALNRMWAQFLPQMLERVAILEAAAAALSTGKLTAAQQEEAKGAAHNLAGVLGTFGLTRGTELAREAEVLYSGELETDPAAGQRLTSIASEVREIIESRK